MENFTLIEYQKERDFSQKMSVVFEFVRQNFKSLSRCLLFIAGPPVAIGAVFFNDFFNRILGFSKASRGNAYGSGVENIEDYFTSITFLLQVVGILVFLWIGGVITIACVYGYMRLYREKGSNQIEVSEVWSYVRQNFGRYFGTVTSYFFLTMITFMILSIPLMLVMGVAATISPFLTIFFVLGFYVGAGLLGMNLSMIFIIRAAEPVSFFDGLQRLVYLVKGKVWSTFGVGALNTLIQSVISGVFLIPWYIILALSFLHEVDSAEFQEPSSVWNAVGSVFFILYFICNIMLYALPLLGLAFQYYNLVELKEARGLLNNLETFGETSAPKQTDEHY
ncbi:hypothetical protein KK062_00500 [Fulvivirgaceae bacterium PWU5]|uniref:Uncharacterized protein n=1 Tax=Dawidia cretensis TaxID=2782350 RepID=A0AAP2GMP9_9BACT|nr:hypothetical protein [Dawidia cretensis]MBT1706676.1 hypothetical protein [Dawidia cretensis]